MQSYRFIVSGKVQGVWYRKSVAHAASSAGFSGYVRNCADGTVEVGVTLEASRFDAFVELLREGSPMSRVESIEHEPVDTAFRGGFEIRR